LTSPTSNERYTLVSFHAHPDDESLLTGGTLAKAVAEGHRVVLVTATDGGRGLAGPLDGAGPVLATRRMDELRQAARQLGCQRVLSLEYGDSGTTVDPSDPEAFANADVDEAACRLARILTRERADVLTVYDSNGGYGHPDHVQVHRVGTLAAQLAGTPVILEATVPATLFRAVTRALALLRHPMGAPPPLGRREMFSDSRRITHRVGVHAHLRAKRAAMSAHASQRRAEGQARVLDGVLRLPDPVFSLVFGREWFVEVGRSPRPRQTDIFASLRTARRSAVS
jgi:LmbE family N-acetylglucosaminyl deacetylase